MIIHAKVLDTEERGKKPFQESERNFIEFILGQGVIPVTLLPEGRAEPVGIQKVELFSGSA